jgi:hypothetical protein
VQQEQAQLQQQQQQQEQQQEEEKECDETKDPTINKRHMSLVDCSQSRRSSRSSGRRRPPSVLAQEAASNIATAKYVKSNTYIYIYIYIYIYMR